MDAVDLSGMTPLMYAVHNDHGDAAGLLCDYGADVGVWMYGVFVWRLGSVCALFLMQRSVAERGI